MRLCHNITTDHTMKTELEGSSFCLRMVGKKEHSESLKALPSFSLGSTCATAIGA